MVGFSLKRIKYKSTTYPLYSSFKSLIQWWNHLPIMKTEYSLSVWNKIFPKKSFDRDKFFAEAETGRVSDIFHNQIQLTKLSLEKLSQQSALWLESGISSSLYCHSFCICLKGLDWIIGWTRAPNYWTTGWPL